ncbi:hypothetical protein B0T17DRAFT_511362 [Bombardia bombarda]|uniref:Uncharacterized protein n=1 Tax=Bombardia bombarda TaxID=252184 RepID=A0AA39T2L1_9PEZI|nr:hypothetical protein B0T17DRAFT_511362 [Bombardia bombarda]
MFTSWGLLTVYITHLIKAMRAWLERPPASDGCEQQPYVTMNATTTHESMDVPGPARAPAGCAVIACLSCLRADRRPIQQIRCVAQPIDSTPPPPSSSLLHTHAGLLESVQSTSAFFRAQSQYRMYVRDSKDRQCTMWLLSLPGRKQGTQVATPEPRVQRRKRTTAAVSQPSAHLLLILFLSLHLVVGACVTKVYPLCMSETGDRRRCGREEVKEKEKSKNFDNEAEAGGMDGTDERDADVRSCFEASMPDV